ncbi:Hpt domain-containing protein [Pseudoalteromonas sp. KG3]|uniref:Hpt domain-containing protein n=1 Tax=Pseudoalteromonas prydzensis TaxID=182141 RepID=A0ABR9FP11_9GAMM|nr:MULTISPECIES: potassium channel family protein [Pseudoalteromonas]MBE0458555.1 Hpt domain-containing protein [Pseudoalteromonas prydzensis]WKD23426.1 Hpt domain-containing protein [Pseudoalteromonas sp. KG3]
MQLNTAASLSDNLSALLNSFYFSVVTFTTLGYGDRMNGFANKPVDINQLNQEISQVLGLGLKKAVLIEQSDPKAKHIDFKKGSQLWGSKCKQLTQIQRFVDEQKILCDTLFSGGVNALSDPQSSLHTLKGLTGNLGLPTMMKLFSALEKAPSAQQQAEIIAQLQTELSSVNVLLRENTLACKPATLEDNEQKTQLISITEFKTLCEQLHQHAENAELNDELLTTIKTHAPLNYQSDIDDIIELFDQFDFYAAQANLESLISLLIQTAKDGG